VNIKRVFYRDKTTPDLIKHKEQINKLVSKNEKLREPYEKKANENGYTRKKI
jgi:hypothetical protein